MKRDFELIRALLLEIEGDSTVDIATYTEAQKNYHKRLIIEAGLAHGVIKDSSREFSRIPSAVIIRGLTWSGHEFLDQARPAKIWERAKEHLAVPYTLIRRL